MSGYKNFAVAGVGTIGKPIVEELIKKRDAGDISSITVLTRSSESHKDLAERGVKVVAIDYNAPASLESALSGTDVVISVLGHHGLGQQVALATSAKAASVKLFVPSEFACEPHAQFEHPAFKQKEAVKQKLKEIDLPYTIYYIGLLANNAFLPDKAAAFGLNFATGEFSIPGSGNGPVSWVTAEDAARFVAYSLTALPREKIELRIFRLEADRLSFNDLVSVWEERSGKPVSVSHRPRSDIEETLKKNPMDFVALFSLALDSGYLTVGGQKDLPNPDYPEWKPKKVVDILAERSERLLRGVSNIYSYSGTRVSK